MQIENQFKKNIFKSRTNIIDKNIFGDKKEKIKMEGALKSVKVPKHFFTNFLANHGDPMFKFVKRQYYAMNDSNYDIYENFELKSVDFGGNLKEQKLKDIYIETYGEKLNDVSQIYRLKNIENKAFQLYINKIDSNNYEIILIDLYHLIIPAADTYLRKTKADLKGDFDKVKNHNFCLSNVLK